MLNTVIPIIRDFILFLLLSFEKAYEFWVGIADFSLSINSLLSSDRTNYLYVVIIEEYQNRGIATAMVAQLLDILYFLHYTKLTSEKIYMISHNIYMSAIAKRLLFIYNDNKEYEIDYKILKKYHIH